VAEQQRERGDRGTTSSSAGKQLVESGTATAAIPFALGFDGAFIRLLVDCECGSNHKAKAKAKHTRAALWQ